VVRGEVYFLDLAPRSGSEQSGRRPCIVVSNDAFSDNARWRSVTVVPLTSAERWRRSSPTTVMFEPGESNLPRASTALAHQVTTVDKGKIVGTRVGELAEAKLRELARALRNYLALGE